MPPKYHKLKKSFDHNLYLKDHFCSLNTTSFRCHANNVEKTKSKFDIVIMEKRERK